MLKSGQSDQSFRRHADYSVHRDTTRGTWFTVAHLSVSLKVGVVDRRPEILLPHDCALLACMKNVLEVDRCWWTCRVVFSARQGHLHM